MVSPTSKGALVYIYFDCECEDPHGEYAQFAGITRDQAKREIYTYLHTHPFLKRVQMNARESGQHEYARKMVRRIDRDHPSLDFNT